MVIFCTELEESRSATARAFLGLVRRYEPPTFISGLAEKGVGVCDGRAPRDRGKGDAEWHGLKSKKRFFLGAAWDRWRASASASRRFGAVLKALAELGLSVPGSAEP